MSQPTILTIGHSTRSLEELLALLMAHAVRLLVDVRAFPRSRRHPQFNAEELPAPLAAAGVDYAHMPGLGGRRKPRPDSTNTGWRSAGFQGYADYMETEEFEQQLQALLARARTTRCAVMCAEAVPWRCHRSLLADALTVRGARVEHILSHAAPQPHELTSWAHVAGTRLVYQDPKTGEAEQLTLDL